MSRNNIEQVITLHPKGIPLVQPRGTKHRSYETHELAVMVDTFQIINGLPKKQWN
jgi:hypothetical protein